MNDLRFKMEGQIFDEGIPLPIALASLQDIQAIFDKTYLVVNGSKRITKKDRELFHLKTFAIKQGSLETDLSIFLDTAQFVLPVVSAFGVNDIWTLTKESWEFLKIIYEFSSSGDKPTYSANDNGTINVHNGDITHIYNAPVYQIAQLSVNNWRSLNHKLKKGQIDSYILGNQQYPEISLAAENKNIFDNPTKVDKESIQIVCDIFDFNKRQNSGKLSINDSGAIPEGDYNFTVIGSQDYIEYISSMAKSETTVTVFKEVSINPLGDSTIVRLHIVEINS